MLTTAEITDSTESLICQKCPYLGGRPPEEVLRELEHVKMKNAQLRRIFDRATEAFKERDEKIRQLEEENNILRKKLQDLHQKPFVINKKSEERGALNESSVSSSRPRGAPPGHRGGTRRKPEKVDGDNAWLWCFVNNHLVLYKIDRSRASAVVEEVMGKDYPGVLGSDCYLSYNPVKAKDKQKCLRHYEADAKDIKKFYPNDGEAVAFASQLKDIFKRAREVKKDWKAGEISDQQALEKAEEFEDELDELIKNPLQNEPAEKLRVRLMQHREENFTFLRYQDVDPDNNIAERALRPSVIMRKITYGNNSSTGAGNHQIMMSVIETAEINGTEPLQILMKLTSGREIEELKQLLAWKLSTGCPWVAPSGAMWLCMMTIGL